MSNETKNILFETNKKKHVGGFFKNLSEPATAAIGIQ